MIQGKLNKWHCAIGVQWPVWEWMPIWYKYIAPVWEGASGMKLYNKAMWIGFVYGYLHISVFKVLK